MSEELHLTDAEVDDYAEGALESAARASVERHLASCARCRSVVEKTHAVVVWARRDRAIVTAPAELWPLVASSTIHLAAVRRQVIASMRGLLLAGAIALVAATAMVTWKVARWTSGPRVVAPPLGGEGRHLPGIRRIAPMGRRPPAAQPPP
jgi:predicted anti-sigma-YlaC factor YlaD